MRVAFITDTHANLPALEAALADIARAGCDLIYHGGDAIGIGPYPRETLERMLAEPNMRFIMGNHDAYFVFGEPGWLSEGEARHNRWVAAELGGDLRARVARWPYRTLEEWDGVRVVFAHYGLLPEPGPDGQPQFKRFINHASAADLDALFFTPDDPGADLVFYGHHHPASDLRGRARYVNPGALGCFRQPLARWALLETLGPGRYRLEQRALVYDDSGLLEAFEQRAVPERAFIRRAFFEGDFEGARGLRD
ncbi:putative phosphodiesterase [Deinobacterium chartae]|uniref:Putative phosphodiesterase n=1 Tax=Deinobacterium chartae TaxID=521158 RepID=A0A841HZQ7_9DEIO|nr:metallophosphoesterase family protein [Deinobacterium chartae]MBB6098164.1 putative phosphodiesterase [Deinobacterium chartae]